MVEFLNFYQADNQLIFEASRKIVTALNKNKSIKYIINKVANKLSQA